MFFKVKFKFLFLVILLPVSLLLLSSCRSFGNALVDGQPAEVQKYIKSGINVNEKAKYEGDVISYRNPLELAINYSARQFNYDKILMLIEAGADVNIELDGGLTPLHYAASSGDTHIVLLFLNAGAKINTKDSLGLTPLSIAACLNYDVNMSKFLLERGANSGEVKSILLSSISSEIEESRRLRYKDLLALMNVKNVKSVLFRATISNIINNLITIQSPASKQIRIGMNVEFQNDSGIVTGKGTLTEIFHTHLKSKLNSGNPQKKDFAIIYGK